MPTQEEVHRLVAKFERKYPKSLSGRLAWWVRVLGIDHTRIFRLLGLSSPEAARTSLSAFPRIVESHKDRAETVDELLGRRLHAPQPRQQGLLLLENSMLHFVPFGLR